MKHLVIVDYALYIQNSNVNKQTTSNNCLLKLCVPVKECSNIVVVSCSACFLFKSMNFDLKVIFLTDVERIAIVVTNRSAVLNLLGYDFIFWFELKVTIDLS